MKSIKTLILFSVVVSVTSCMSYKDVEIVSYNEVELERISPEGIFLKSNVTVKNPNDYKITVDTKEMKVYINGDYLGEARFEKPVTLQSNATEDHNIRIIGEIPEDGTINLGRLTASTLLGGGLKIRVTGFVVGKAKGIKKEVEVDFQRTVSL